LCPPLYPSTQKCHQEVLLSSLNTHTTSQPRTLKACEAIDRQDLQGPDLLHLLPEIILCRPKLL
jgi:hypothetical protein